MCICTNIERALRERERERVSELSMSSHNLSTVRDAAARFPKEIQAPLVELKINISTQGCCKGSPPF